MINFNNNEKHSVLSSGAAEAQCLNKKSNLTKDAWTRLFKQLSSYCWQFRLKVTFDRPFSRLRTKFSEFCEKQEKAGMDHWY
jgi:hypothetical protein